MEQADCIVIGAGAVGLAVARELAIVGRDVIVLEAASAIGTETSSRNSEVIHAGLYYAPGSLKARLCLEGKQRLYAYCAERGVETRAIGKLLVAVSQAQIPKLAQIKTNAEQCGVNDLRWLTAGEAHALEPEVQCAAALFSPGSGILDSHAFMLALRGDLENAGGVIAFNSAVRAGKIRGDKVEISTDDVSVEARLVINSAGLHAPAVARSISGIRQASIPLGYFAKGNYFALSGVRAPFTHLIYPMPEQAGLGIHATLDLGGGVRFGPDVEWIGSVDYNVDAGRAHAFEIEIKRYWPGLPASALSPAYSGVRPKIAGPGESAADFVIQGPTGHGVPGLWNLFGIESPGLTASLALAALLRQCALA